MDAPATSVLEYALWPLLTFTMFALWLAAVVDIYATGVEKHLRAQGCWAWLSSSRSSRLSRALVLARFLLPGGSKP